MTKRDLATALAVAFALGLAMLAAVSEALRHGN